MTKELSISSNNETKVALGEVAQDAHEDTQFVKGLTLTSATTLVVGSMIGSGIFIVPAEIARQVNSPALLLLVWMITGVMTIIGALSYGELAAMMPRAGGQYVFLRESLGPLCGFLYGWTLFLAIQTGTIAAVGVAFGKFLGVLVPWVSSTHWLIHICTVPAVQVGPVMLGNMDVGLSTQNLIAILVIISLTVVNIYGVKTGAIVQNIFTVTKAAGLAALIVASVTIGRNTVAHSANYGAHFWANSSLRAQHEIQLGGGAMVLVGSLTVIAVAQVGSLFSADAWNNVTFTAGEVKNAPRNLPISLALGTAIVIVLYLLANIAYLSVLPLDGSPYGSGSLERGIKYATEDRVATAVMTQILGSRGGLLMAITIMISTFGCINGLILAGARVYYAMAKDNLFFSGAGNLHPLYKTPVLALILQMTWTCFLCLSGTYSQLLDYIVFTVLLFYVLTILSLFILRRTSPEIHRPYKAFGYPVLQIAYVVMAIGIECVLLRYKPQYTWPGVFIVLSGVSVYYLWMRPRGPINRVGNGTSA